MSDAPSDEENRVLILAPTGNDARLSAEFLHRAGITTRICGDVPALCAELEGGCAAILLAEETLADGTMTPLVEALAGQPAWSDLPITIITGGGRANGPRLRRLETFGPAGNVTLLERPFRPETLVSATEVALRARRRQHEVRDLLQRLQSSEERLTGILDSISDAFIALDETWRITYVNPSYVKLVSPMFRGASGLVGGNFWEKFPAVRHSEFESVLRDWMAHRTARTFDFYDEPLRAWLAVRGFPSAGGLSLSIENVTERRERENEVAELSRRIHEQARLFDITLSNITDFAYTFDRAGRFLFANKPLLDLLGLPLGEVAGRTFSELPYPPELAAKLDRQVQTVFATGQTLRDETAYVAPTGQPGFYEYIFTPVFSLTGEIEVVAGSTRIITERKRAEAALEEARDLAEAANRSKDRFLAVLSHELRTPLTPVLMAASALEMDPKLPAGLRTDMAMIRRNVELETKLIDDLLDLSRITSGKLALRVQPVDLNEAVREVCAICQQQILEKGVRLHVALAPGEAWVRADPARLQQMLWNVLKNAAKFAPDAGEIWVSTRADDARFVVEVRDNGIGIDPEILPRIFDAFEQGEERITRQFGGLGLGLAITKALAELHEGTIAAQSDGPGAGSTFTLTLPGAVATLPAARAPGEAAREGDPLRILMVEDHADTAVMLARLLGASGYVVTVATSVGAALEEAARQGFDLLVSDIGLPDATGYELMRRLRERGDMPRGIAMSGYGMEEDVRRSFDAGFNEHLVKPVDVSSLEAAIRRLARTK